MNKPKNEITSFASTLILLLLSATIVIISVYQQLDLEKYKQELSNEISKKVTQEVSNNVTKEISKDVTEKITKDVANNIEESLKKTSEFTDFNTLPNLKSINLVKNFESWTPSSNIPAEKTKMIIVVEKGELTKGYLHVRASINGKALSKWESIYVKMNLKGGHLFRPQSLPMPNNEKTDLLYALNEVPYLETVPYSENRTPKTTDWFGLFTDKAKISVYTFISSLKPALIEEITLFYECKDNNECLLSLK